MKKAIVKILLIFLFMGFYSMAESIADEVILDNGDRITGKVIKMEENRLTIETSYAGEIVIEWDRIRQIDTDSEITVLLSDETSLRGLPRKTETDRMALIVSQIDAAVIFSLADVMAVNPIIPDPGPAVNVRGRLNLGLSETSGNTDTESYHFNGELVARTEKNRYTAGGELNKKKDDGRPTENRKLGYLQYDHFLSKKWFLYNNAFFERDRFKDLNLRTAIGAGGGYQFFEGPDMNISVEAGLTYINEDYYSAPDEDYPSGRWSFNFDRYYFERFIQFFHFHEGFVGFDDSSDILLRTRTGIRIPVYRSFSATFQYNYDYDKIPSPGRKKIDRGYQFSLGYVFDNK